MDINIFCMQLQWAQIPVHLLNNYLNFCHVPGTILGTGAAQEQQTLNSGWEWQHGWTTRVLYGGKVGLCGHLPACLWLGSLPASQVPSSFHLPELAFDVTVIIIKILKDLIFMEASFVPGALLFQAWLHLPLWHLCRAGGKLALERLSDRLGSVVLLISLGSWSSASQAWGHHQKWPQKTSSVTILSRTCPFSDGFLSQSEI